MTITASEIYESFLYHGYYKSAEPVTRPQFEDLMGEFAERVEPVEIRVGIPHPNLGGTHALMSHNEANHFADGIVWYCIDDGGAPDRFYISAMAPIEAELTDEDLEHLANAHVLLMRQRVPRTTLARQERGRPIIFCPFGDCSYDDTVPGRQEVIDRYYQLIRRASAQHRLRGPDMAVRTGEFILVDDRRYMHGRDLLPEGTSRMMERSYVVMHDREHWLTRTVEQRPFGHMHPRAPTMVAL